MAEASPAMQAAMAARTVRMFGAVEILFPGYALRLIDGPGAFAAAPWNAFTGRDPRFGTIASIDTISDGTGDDAPAISLTLNPANDIAVASLAASAMQGSRVRCWLGVVQATTGIVVPDPILLFDGKLDVATIKWGSRSRSVDYDIVSDFERFFDLEEAIRLSDSHHQDVWPGEQGLAFVTGVTATVPWGTNNLGSVVTK
ncbi:hypothetical protein ASE75_06015 [Sphingomonas sp. Leaf17]|uniref:hypothetical protein n=1 Tax=Sphingomonas sp. Leaf17 TaxID=1735683 RepID=UPI0006F53CB0|nr:hypothetical protein [Sphingomonas sp. Leaf17]KQM65784.1 hypothetical protein ASE75_06015 [Sphingomonas sp. Leaf17]